MNTTEVLFVALPYAALAALVIGVVYRYSSLGFKVTSLSSQFLEGRQLFWGSQPFHWGILVVFLGHLAAFAIPGTVLAWNGSPLRLLILELTLFAFALSALFGLLALLLRRASNARLRAVTSRMDLVVYLLLAVQIVTGLGVAYFYNWGSSWFAAVLTPYLRSIFVLDPKVEGVAGLPFLVQLHIATAFVIFGMIPYTRLIHFIVFPFNYLWRSYQVVIWHWNPEQLRTTTNHFRGARPRNN